MSLGRGPDFVLIHVNLRIFIASDPRFHRRICSPPLVTRLRTPISFPISISLLSATSSELCARQIPSPPLPRSMERASESGWRLESDREEGRKREGGASERGEGEKGEGRAQRSSASVDGRGRGRGRCLKGEMDYVRGDTGFPTHEAMTSHCWHAGSPVVPWTR